MTVKRVYIEIKGLVQGVGFRPFMYRLASECRLQGWVKNNHNGVIAEVEGEPANIDHFLFRLTKEPPPRSKIHNIRTSPLVPTGCQEFKILSSEAGGKADTEIPCDFAICRECREEFSNPGNRRFAYPLINCTSCGPRFTIIKASPYDRINTTMSGFAMCTLCQEEYQNPGSRRFHAEATSCSQCGPRLALYNEPTESNPIRKTVELLSRGKIVAIKGLGGYNLACDVRNTRTLTKLRELKARPSKAFALMGRDLDTIGNYCELSALEADALRSPEAPIVILRKKRGIALTGIAPNNNYLGFMLPYSGLHIALLAEIDLLVMTSANLRSEPIAIDDKEMFDLCERGICDEVLWHNRPIENRADDSIIQFTRHGQQILRRSRGFAPSGISTSGVRIPSDILALGGHLKNTVALSAGEKVILSQHLGDLEDYRNEEFRDLSIQKLKSLFQIEYKLTVGDSHPSLSRSDQSVQHHRAHFLSVIAEHGLWKENITGLIADGTGIGDDGTIWGFDFFCYSGNLSTALPRVAALNNFPLPGGISAIKEVDRIGIALSDGLSAPLLFPQSRRHEILGVMATNINNPLCHSLGRLFDGISSLLGFTQASTYEGEAAEWLQKRAENFLEKRCCFLGKHYVVEINRGKHLIIEYRSLIKQMLDDLESGLSKELIAWKFHYWIGNAIKTIVERLSCVHLAISGGCFQNRLLCDILDEVFKDTDVRLYFNRQVPTNDGGLSFGQIFGAPDLRFPCV